MDDQPMAAVAQSAAERVREGGMAQDGVPANSVRLLRPLPAPPSTAERQAKRVASARRLELLARTIETEIVPRLVIAHRELPATARAFTAQPTPADVEALTRCVLASDTAGSLDLCEALRARGASAPQVFLELIAPVARKLGEMWADDECSFADVTLGLGVLHRLVYEMRATVYPDLAIRDPRRRALIATTPGEQHTLGLAMVVEFFRQAGWNVSAEEPGPGDDVVERVATGWFAVAGFSLSSDNFIDTLAGTIRTVRRMSCNPYIGIMVGGPVFTAQPELAALVGADAMAMDGREAALRAEGILALLETTA